MHYGQLENSEYASLGVTRRRRSRLRWNSGESFPNLESAFCLQEIKVLILGVIQGLKPSTSLTSATFYKL